jgi:hypothetical protein
MARDGSASSLVMSLLTTLLVSSCGGKAPDVPNYHEELKALLDVASAIVPQDKQSCGINGETTSPGGLVQMNHVSVGDFVAHVMASSLTDVETALHARGTSIFRKISCVNGSHKICSLELSVKEPSASPGENSQMWRLNWSLGPDGKVDVGSLDCIQVP